MVCQLVSALGITQAVVPVLEDELEELDKLERELELILELMELERELELDRELELNELERELELIELDLELDEIEFELDRELELIELDLLEDDKESDDERDEDETLTVLHTVPVTTGFSAEPPFLST